MLTPGASRLWRCIAIFGVVIATPMVLQSYLFSGVSAKQVAESDLTVHEWGTFTSIAGPDGQAMPWLPLTGSTDLPAFVEHLSGANFKGGLRGTVRMETPVLYFYSPRETTVSVHTTFAKGLITEWYPHASVPALDPRRDLFFSTKQTEGAITWNSVRIEPTGDNFLTETSANHYYTARKTLSALLSVKSASGSQHEKFLFYRGVSAIRVPLKAAVSSETSIVLENHFSAPIRDAILFERRGTNVGYRVLGPLTDQGSFTPPTLNDSLDSLFPYLEALLVSEGLYSDEAHAMVETWKDSWFEEGSRILYVVPRAFVDSVLPLTIDPAPGQITRVFIGRIELVTAATQQAVESAFAVGDHATLAKYNRFLEPILQEMRQSTSDAARQRRLAKYLDSAYTAYYSQPRH